MEFDFGGSGIQISNDDVTVCYDEHGFPFLTLSPSKDSSLDFEISLDSIVDDSKEIKTVSDLDRYIMSQLTLKMSVGFLKPEDIKNTVVTPGVIYATNLGK